MSNPRADIAHERRRQIQVRRALEAGLGTGGPAGDRAAFYLACGDYLVWSMERLHAQDQQIHDRLGQRLPPAEVEAHASLAALSARQQKSRALMAEFAAALAGLRAAGPAGVETFEAAARQFVATFTGLLLPRKNPFFRHTDALFSESDWTSIAGVSDASRAEEVALFARVQVTAPPGSDPASFTAEHLPG